MGASEREAAMTRKTIFITGSSRGIGKAIALKFAKEHYNVVINGISKADALLSVQKEIQDCHAPCLALSGDVGDMEQCQFMFDEIKRRFSTVDILVNNAGISYIGLLQDMSSADWDRIIRTNLTSVFHCSKLAIPDMLANKKGKIINISSVWGNVGASCEVAYSASKGGIHAFTKALAKELAPSNIQVNAIACGAIDTEMNGFLSEEERASLIDEIPAGRLGKTDEVSELVYQLAQGSSYLTGQVIGLDGGWI